MSKSVCPQCGNVIQEWMHGQCTTCQRIEQEQKRYGRRRPTSQVKSRKRHTRSKPKSTSPKIYRQGRRACPICGKKVRADRYYGHMWHSHGADPYTPKKEIERLARAQKSADNIRRKSNPRESELKLELCPTCGVLIDSSQLDYHRFQHQNRQSQWNARVLRQGINDFLEVVYEKPFLLSHILRRGGITENSVALLKNLRLNCFIETVAKQWQKTLRQVLSPRQVDILVRHYSLDGATSLPLAALASEYNESEVKINMIFDNSLVALREPRCRRQLERKVIEAARYCL